MKDLLNKYLQSLYTKVNKKFYIIVIIFFAVLLIWTIISRLFGVGDNNENEDDNKNKTSYQPAETVISGEDITEAAYKEDETLIKQFVDYCNAGNTHEAYNILSKECKELILKTEDEFIQNYYTKIFATKRIYNIQSWISNNNYNTYRIRLIDDIMSTGDYSNSKNYQDYITVVQEENNKYLNIMGLISKEDINDIAYDTQELTISVKNLITYIDYEEYVFSIKNKTDKTILMDTLENASDTMVLELNNNKKRTCNTNNLSQLDLIIDGYMTKEINIRYNKTAGGSSDENEKIHFLNIIKDYDAYMRDKESYNDILKITINL